MSKSACISAYLWWIGSADKINFENFLVSIASTKIFQITEIILATVILIPCVVLFVEVIVAFQARRYGAKKSSGSLGTGYKRGILIPAHNEAAVIGETLLTLKSQIRATDQLVVIADNCTDETAAIAQQAGATVICRHNEQRRGKGYALDYGVQYLSKNPPDIVIMVDADCQVLSGFVDTVAEQVIKTHRPVQAAYLIQQEANPSPKEMISTFAFKVKNFVRPLGMRQLGFPCLLTGSGMAFPWSTIKGIDLATSNIVEDMQLGLDLAIAGYLPLQCSDAIVLGKQPKQSSAAIAQRTRWEHGHLQTLLNSASSLFWEGIKQRRLELIMLALDISVPPLALLVLLWLTIASVITVFTVFFSGIWLPLAVIYYAGFSLIAAIFLSWYGFAREDIPINKLIYIPLYILWKIPLYFNFLIKPEKDWVRTARED